MSIYQVRLGPQIGPGGKRLVAATQTTGEGVRIALGAATPLASGVPVPPGSEVIRVQAPACGHEDCPHEAEHLFSVPGHGPSQVATPAYRTGWERIFGDRESN